MNQAKKFTLNQGQKAAADELFKFLMGDEPEIILSGPGGVGKSYLISYLIDEIMPRYEDMCELVNLPGKYTSITMTATSNKAAEVLAEATQRPVSTIHSFMNLIVKTDYTTGKTKLTPTGKWTVHTDTVLIIDEYSMIDRELHSYIKKGTANCKIIYVGDHCQLAAVGDMKPYVSTLAIRRIDLTEPMRNKDQPALQNLCTQLRETVETLNFGSIDLVPGSIDLLNDEEMQLALMTDFATKESAENVRLLAYSNNRVNQYNDYVRIVRGESEQPKVGDNLIANSPVIIQKKTVLSTEEPVYISSMDDHETILHFPEGGELAVKYGFIIGRFGSGRLPIPVDREHYHALLKYYGRIKDWTTYFTLKETIPDLRPKDASTIHKSQGSSYDTVYIDLQDLSTCTVSHTAARLMYVAVSRARNRVVFYGNLTPRLGKINV